MDSFPESSVLAELELMRFNHTEEVEMWDVVLYT
jgi:hypothetical protein